MKVEKIKKKIEEMFDAIGKKEVLFISYVVDGELELSAARGEISELKNGFKSVIRNGMEEDAPEAIAWMSNALVEAVFETIEEVEKERVVKKKEKKTSGCSDCQFNMVCNDKEAIAYRKAHRIPRPKKK